MAKRIAIGNDCTSSLQCVAAPIVRHLVSRVMRLKKIAIVTADLAFVRRGCGLEKSETTSRMRRSGIRIARLRLAGLLLLSSCAPYQQGGAGDLPPPGTPVVLTTGAPTRQDTRTQRMSPNPYVGITDPQTSSVGPLAGADAFIKAQEKRYRENQFSLFAVDVPRLARAAADGPEPAAAVRQAARIEVLPGLGVYFNDDVGRLTFNCVLWASYGRADGVRWRSRYLVQADRPQTFDWRDLGKADSAERQKFDSALDLCFRNAHQNLQDHIAGRLGPWINVSYKSTANSKRSLLLDPWTPYLPTSAAHFPRRFIYQDALGLFEFSPEFVAQTRIRP